MTTVRHLLRERAELVVLAAFVVGTLFLPGRMPFGIYGLGLVDGAALALQAIGIVLVYRSDRIINFAQIQLGALGGSLFVELVQRRTLLLGARYLCPSCVGVETVRLSDGETFLRPVDVDGWLLHVNFWLSGALSLGLVLLLTYVGYVLVIRRFAEAPRLVLTVVTIGLGQVFLLFRDLIPFAFRADRPIPGNAPFPFDLSVRLSSTIFGTAQLATLLVATCALVALTMFFGRSAIGVVLRGASENPNRARTLGVNIGSVNAVVWLVAGGLSGVASLLAASSVGAVELGGAANLVRMLAAAVIAGMASIPLAVAASLSIGVLDQAVLWTTKSTAAVDGILVLGIVVVLMVQRRRSGRADIDVERGWRLTREMRPVPEELRGVDVVRRWTTGFRVALGVVVLGLPWILAPGQTNLATVTLIYAMVGLSLLILTGWAGQISLGQFAFAAVGAYVTAILGWPFPFSVIAGALAGAAVALVVGLPALRLRGLHLAISTLAFAVAVTSVLLNPRYLGDSLPSSLTRPSMLGLDLDDQRTFYYVVLAFLVLAVLSVVGMRRSRAARALIASRDNEPAAQSFGINLVRARLGAFAVSGFVAAFAGGLFALSQYDVAASGFGVEQSINVFLMAVIGGLGSVSGPLIGAGYVGATAIFTTNIYVAIAATGVGVVGLLLFAPGGLGQVAHAIRDAFLRRVAERNRIDVPSLMADRRRSGADRAPIAVKVREGGGGTAFVPRRYRLDRQWRVEADRRTAVEEATRRG